MDTPPKGKYLNTQKRIEELEAKVLQQETQLERMGTQLAIMAALINDRNYAIAALSLANLQVTQCFIPDVMRATIGTMQEHVTAQNERVAAQTEKLKEDNEDVHKV